MALLLFLLTGRLHKKILSELQDWNVAPRLSQCSAPAAAGQHLQRKGCFFSRAFGVFLLLCSCTFLNTGCNYSGGHADHDVQDTLSVHPGQCHQRQLWRGEQLSNHRHPDVVLNQSAINIIFKLWFFRSRIFYSISGRGCLTTCCRCWKTLSLWTFFASVTRSSTKWLFKTHHFLFIFTYQKRGLTIIVLVSFSSGSHGCVDSSDNAGDAWEVEFVSWLHM